MSDEGSDEFSGMAGTEEMYWAVTKYNACGGLVVTASHNPIEYNGIKFVQKGSRPFGKTDFEKIKTITCTSTFSKKKISGEVHYLAAEARSFYIKKLLSLVEVRKLKPLKIVINSGNGAAGPTLDSLFNAMKSQGVKAEFHKFQHNPDGNFPNGVPNPLLEANQIFTSNLVRESKADLGVAFDGDFDRCFLFDETGQFVPTECIIALISSVFLEKEKNVKIIHDPRVIWKIIDVVERLGGETITSKTGHTNMKKSMRDNGAVYGGIFITSLFS